jgi:hypothetical protein
MYLLAGGDFSLRKGNCNDVPIDLFYISPLFCKKGDNPQNISFTAEARRWIRFTYDKRFDRQDIPHLPSLFLKKQLSSFYIS